jgi:hypothetical protein
MNPNIYDGYELFRLLESNMMLTVSEGHSDRDAKVRKRAKDTGSEGRKNCHPHSAIFFEMLNYLVILA